MLRNQTAKPGFYSFIAGISLACGISVIGLSAAFLHAIGQHDYKGSPNGDVSSTNSTLVIAVAITIVGTGMQLIASLILWLTKDKDSKPILIGFIIGQGIIQLILIICLILAVYNQFKPLPTNGLLTSTSGGHPLGHGFWIILLINIVIHLTTVIYLVNLIVKRKGYEKTEEMSAVVIHRRVPSRIPKDKRQGMK